MEHREAHPKRSVGQLLAWLLFCAVCVQFALSQWHFTVIDGEKTNLFFGVIASLAFFAAIPTARKGHVRAGSIEIAVSFVLLGLAAASGLHSAIPMSSSARAFVLMSTGLGGFWCSRILLNTTSRQRAFVWLCTAILAALISLGLISQVLFGKPTSLISVLYYNAHHLAHMLLLLAFAPLALIGSKRRLQIPLGLVLLVSAAVVLFYCATAEAVASAVLLAPLIIVVVTFSVNGSRAVGLALALLTLLVAAGALYVNYASTEGFSNPKYQAYRVESYPFSWHVAKSRPLLGVGLRAPRDDLVEDYEPRHPQLTRKEFRDQVADLVTPENNFLALLTGCGIPFTVIYAAALLILLFRLVRSVERPPPELYFHPVVLLVAVTGSLLHSVTTDTMLHAQLCWFFHILLGLIPKPSGQRLEQKRSSWRSVAFRSAGVVAAVILGIVVGTHPALAPGKLDPSSYLENLPIISAFSKTDDKKEAASSPAQKTSQPAPVLPGSLLVKLDNLDVGKERWQVAFVLDNSESMASRSDQWPTGRLQTAKGLIGQVSEALPPNSRIAVRSFTGEISLKMGSHEIPLTVSQRIYGWAQTPFGGLAGSLEKITPLDRPIDPCTAVEISSKRDFDAGGAYAPRIVLLTDGGNACTSSASAEILRKGKDRTIGSVDVVALGMDPANKETFSKLSKDTNGTFLDVALPARVKELLAHYAKVLQVSKPLTMEISGTGGVRKAVVGERIVLPPGLYSLWLPRDLNAAQSEQKIDRIEVSPEKLTTVTLSRQDGRLTVSTTRR
ncbi:MAG: VWA domain-containing protein [Pseudomonadota bacterium]